MNSMEKADIIVIGAGIAGLTAGLYASRAGMNVIILDKFGAGGQLLQIAEIENYPGIFPSISGFELSQTLYNQAKEAGAKFVQSAVISVDKKDSTFYVKTQENSYESLTLIIATGAEHRKINLPGEEKFTGKGVSYCAVCDGNFFKGKTVAVVGGGDSACTEALYLADIAEHVHLIHRRDTFRATKTLADKTASNNKITLHLQTVVEEIEGTSFVESLKLKNTATGTSTRLNVSGVFICAGMIPQADLLSMIPKDKNGYIIASEKMSTTTPGLFVAGDVRTKPLRQLITAANDGAIAAESAAEFIRNNK